MSDDTVTRRRFLTGGGRKSATPPWRSVDAVAGAAGDVFWGVWADGDDNLFVVGDNGAVFHFDGDAWARQSSGTTLPLHAVWGVAPDRVFAVGWMGVIATFDGTDWQVVKGGDIDPDSKAFAGTSTNLPLFGLWGRTADEVWAVGDNGRIVHFDGQSWKEQESGTEAHLRHVYGFNDGTLYAVGVHGTVLRGDGDGWEIQDVGTRTNLVRLWGRSADDVYAVGGQYDAQRNGFSGDLLQFDGNRWQTMSPVEPVPRLRALCGDRDGLLVVGDQGTICHVDGRGRWRRQDSGTRHDLCDVVSKDGDRLVIVGDFGTVLSRGDERLASEAATAETSPAPGTGVRWRSAGQKVTDRVLWSVWGASATDIFAVGEAGSIIHYDGNSWSAMETPTSSHLHGVWGRSADDVYAVGQFGLVLHFNGSAWREVHRLAVDVTAVAVWGHGPTDVFVVGDEGLILHFNGDGWDRVNSGTKNALYAVWGMDAEHVLAVGDFGLVLRWNGRSWDEFNAGTENFLYGVWGDALNNVYVAGLSGTVTRFDGRRWSQTPTRQRADLLAIAGAGGVGPFVAGTLGTIMRHDGRRWLAEPTSTDVGLRALWVGPDGTACAVGDAGRYCSEKVRPRLRLLSDVNKFSSDAHH